MSSKKFPKDWSGYDSLDIDIFVEGDGNVGASLLIGDADWQKKSSYWNRHNGSTVFPPGKTTWVISVGGLYRGEAGSRNNDIQRNIDIGSIVRVDFGFGAKGAAGRIVLESLRLVKVSYPGSDEVFFGVRSDFITSSMKGRFDGTAIVLMGCNGLTTTRTAEAFIEKGAKAVVGWSELVSASHTDEATERLLEHLVVDGLTVGEAVEKTTAELGPDPAYGSVLRVYPPEAAASTIRQSS
jgi:hypothetical protein